MNKLYKWFYIRYIVKYFDKVPYTKKILKAPNFFIEDNTYGYPEIFFQNSGQKLIIGKYCSIAVGVRIFLGGNHRADWVSMYPFSVLGHIFKNGKQISEYQSSKGDVIIGNDVWIGNSATILSGVTIGDGAVIGANAVITKNVAPYEVVAGNPMKVVKKRFDDDTIEKLLIIKWWNWDKKKINENLHLLCSTHINEFIDLHGKS